MMASSARETTAMELAARLEGVDAMSTEEAREILDRHARRFLGMSGPEFVAAWDAGEIADPDRPEVMRVVMLLPLAR
jgi:hypothetical protein